MGLQNLVSKNYKVFENIIKLIPKNEIESFFNLGCTIGGYIIFPSNRVDDKMTINGSRGINSKIKDRFDLTLECIKRFYLNEISPLTETLNRYRSFFELFNNFEGYVDFFLLQDLVKEKYSKISYFLCYHICILNDPTHCFVQSNSNTCYYQCWKCKRCT